VPSTLVPRPPVRDATDVEAGEVLLEVRRGHAARGDFGELGRSGGGALRSLHAVHAPDLVEGGEDFESAALDRARNALGGLAGSAHWRCEILHPGFAVFVSTGKEQAAEIQYGPFIAAY
jgi:hypothetical protein